MGEAGEGGICSPRSFVETGQQVRLLPEKEGKNLGNNQVGVLKEMEEGIVL